MIRTYTELSQLKTFQERYFYLQLKGIVGEDTFGWDRYLNQMLYKSYAWQQARSKVILRDNGCDLGIEGRDIFGKIIIHHMNPITIKDIENRNETIFDPEYLICTSHNTHNAIHYGSSDILIPEPITRTKNDTCPWKY